MTDPNKHIRCCVVSDIRLDRNSTGWYDARQTLAQGHWTELLETFDGVEIVARVKTTTADIAAELILPQAITVDAAPAYYGAGGAFLRLRTIFRTVWKLTRRDRVFILREPGLLPAITGLALRLMRKRFTVELLGDPAEALRYSSVPAPRFWSYLTGKLARQVCNRAAAVLYMSHSLERKYPAAPDAISAVISDVRLPDDMWVAPRAERPEPMTLITVASMAQPYKGHAVLLRAVARLRREGLDVKLLLAGDGTERKRLQQQAAALAITDSVEFHGEVRWGRELFALLDRATLFVLPSMTEGLPKAMLEAMARGLPAIGSAVGGVPEILPEEACFPPNDEHALADKIRRLLGDPESLRRLAEHGYEVAQQFRPAILTVRRRAFYKAVRELAR